MPTGTLSTYDLTVGLRLDVEDLIHLLDPFDVPLLGTTGADGRSTLAKGTCFEKKVEWLDETLLNPRTTVNGSHLSTDTTLSFNAGEVLRFQLGDVLLVNDEYIRISGNPDYSADTAPVERGYGGSTAEAFSGGEEIIGVGSAQVEGSDPPDARAVDRANRFNLTEIFGPHQVKVSATENVVRKYGLNGTTEFQHQVANRMKEAAVAIEQAILYGKRHENTSGGWRTMGGLKDYITTNVNALSTAIGEGDLLDELQNIYDQGGNPDRCVMGSQQKRAVSNFANGDIRYGRDETGRGQVVDWFISDFGQVSMHLNRWVKASDIFIFARDQVEVTTLRPLVFEALAKTGDSMKGQLVCEKTLKVRREKHAAYFNNLPTS